MSERKLLSIPSIAMVIGTLMLAQIAMAESATKDGAELTQQLPPSGERLYMTYCAGCHGPDARGDGQLSELLIKTPPDLTLLAFRNGGTFPQRSVRATIDGRGKARAHTLSDMPVWGKEWRRLGEAKDEADVMVRTISLIGYLKSLQRTVE